MGLKHKEHFEEVLCLYIILWDTSFELDNNVVILAEIFSVL